MTRQQGMTLTPDGKTWVGLVQKPSETGGWTIRIATRDAATGVVREYGYDTRSGAAPSTREMVLPLNAHQVLVLEPSGSVGQGVEPARANRVWAVDLAGADNIAGLTGSEALSAKPPNKVPFRDATSALRSFGLVEAEVATGTDAPAFGAGLVPQGIRYDPEFLARGEDYLPEEAASGDGEGGFFAGVELGLPELGHWTRESAAIPGPGGFLILALGLALGLALLSRVGSRRPS